MIEVDVNASYRTSKSYGERYFPFAEIILNQSKMFEGLFLVRLKICSIVL